MNLESIGDLKIVGNIYKENLKVRDCMEDLGAEER
jgi:hypothetical protein